MPDFRGIWSWVFLDRHNSNQSCNVQTSLGKWSNEWVKIDLQKQINKQKFKTQKKNPNKQNPDYWKNYYSWQVYISYQPVQGSSTTEVHKIKTQASMHFALSRDS